ncbi:MAG: PhoPQ-activated pathogenicity protein [Pirellulaceae bacterium]|nr:PhoPQ-activated pathogenicity protein [Pirellulaceae bacterium]
MHLRCYCWLCALAVFSVTGQATGQERLLKASPSPLAGTELSDYVATPDKNYRWEVREESQVQNCEVLRLHLTSQRWHGIDWRHVLTLVKPNNLDTSREDALLVISGGDWHKEWPDNGPATVPVRGEPQMMATVANQFGCVIAILSQVPFQPMMDGKHEDELIAASFSKFMETQDSTWPLLLPMVKSAVRGMDATTAAAQERWGVSLKQFTVTGASKRGWTTWLTGATDQRATAIAPMVIDMLNMSAQMKLQVASFGGYSEQIDDYTDLNLPAALSTPAGQKLQSIVDPFSYREKLTMPKLLIFGTNDRYWPLDACGLYWDQLLGEKHLLYVPNAGHGIKDYARVIGSISALHRSRHGGKPLPVLDWEFAKAGPNVTLDVTAKGGVDTVHGWVAHAPTRDFRDAKWEQQACQTSGDNAWRLTVKKPEEGFMACFVEFVSNTDATPAFFSTNVRIFPAEE